MTASRSKPGDNIYEAACDSIAAAVLAMAMIKNMPLAEDDGLVIAEALVDRLELTDVHALVGERSRDVLDAAIKRADVCLDRLRAARATDHGGGAIADERLRKLIEDLLVERAPAR